jgi:hypothetical protein
MSRTRNVLVVTRSFIVTADSLYLLTVCYFQGMSCVKGNTRTNQDTVIVHRSVKCRSGHTSSFEGYFHVLLRTGLFWGVFYFELVIVQL